MTRICRNCEVSYNDSLFEGIYSDPSNSVFNQCITFGCLYKLLSWARVKHHLLKSENSAESANNSNISDLTGLVHAIIRYIHTYGASTSSTTLQRQLKTQLPVFQSLNRSVTRALSSDGPNLKCCLPANCLYVSCNDTAHVCKTPAQRKRDSRQRNPDERQSEQSLDTARRKIRRVDDAVRQKEQTANTQHH